MSTLRHIIYDLRELLKEYSDDSIYSDEYLAYQINIARSLLLEQKFSNRGFVVPNKIRQTFHYELELVDDNDFITGLGTILRTKEPIEKPLETFNMKMNIKINAGGYDSTYFNFIPMERFPYVGRNKWNQNQIYVTLGTDFRLYFTSNNPSVKLLENIKLSMVCDNPEEAYEASVDYSDTNDFWDIEYPLEDRMVMLMNDMILKRLAQTEGIKLDKNNNADES